MNPRKVISMMGLALAAVLAGEAQAVYEFSSPTLRTEVSGRIDYGSGTETGSTSVSRESAIGAPLSAGQSVGPLAFESSASGGAGRLSATASTTFDPSWQNTAPYAPLRTVSSRSVVEWVDHVTITGGSGLDTATFSSTVEGRLTGSDIVKSSFPMTDASMGFFASYEALQCYWWMFDCNVADADQTLANSARFASTRSSLSMRDEMTSPFTFEYGQTFQLRARLTVDAWDGGEADFANTATFGLLLPKGAVVTSAMGYDYGVAAVPEPSAFAFTGAGMLVLAFAVRQRARRPR